MNMKISFSLCEMTLKTLYLHGVYQIEIQDLFASDI